MGEDSADGTHLLAATNVNKCPYAKHSLVTIFIITVSRY